MTTHPSNPEKQRRPCRPIGRWLAGLLGGLSLTGGVAAQGLLELGESFLEEAELPFSGAYSSSLGWDSDAGNRNRGFSSRGRSITEGGGSMVWQNSLSLGYGVKMGKNDSLSFNGSYANTFFFDPPPGTDDMDHNLRVGLRYSRQVSRQLTLSDSAYVSYEMDPNYDVGLSVTRPTSGYFVASNSLRAQYQWTTRFSTSTGYSFSTILYEDSSLDRESYLRHGLTQDFRYSFKRQLTGVFTYRLGFTDYEGNDNGDSYTHALLAGADWKPKRRFSMTGKVGANYRVYDGDLDNRWAPRVELGLNYAVAKRTSAQWLNMLGLDDTGRAGSQSGYTYRSSLSVGHSFTRRLSGNASVNYIHSDYEDGLGGLNDATEDTISLRLGASYSLWRAVSVFGNYSYTLISEDGMDDYRRHRVLLGLSYAF